MMQIKVRTGDSFVVGIAAAIAVGRFGCLLFGCCYGLPTTLPWGIGFPSAEDGGTIPRHPTQLYESLFHLSFATLAALALAPWFRARSLDAPVSAELLHLPLLIRIPAARATTVWRPNVLSMECSGDRRSDERDLVGSCSTVVRTGRLHRTTSLMRLIGNFVPHRLMHRSHFKFNLLGSTAKR